MGVWGAGNFDTDTALDHIIEVCTPLIQMIRETVASETAMEPDESTSEVMMCNIEILCNLTESLNRYTFKSQNNLQYLCEWPDVEDASKWKATYLGVWDGYIDELDPDEKYKEERRKVIDETFDRFIKLAEGWKK